MKRLRLRGIGAVLLGALLLCSACQSQKPPTLEEEAHALVDLEAGAKERAAKVAVLKEEATLKSCYSYTTGEDNAFYQWLAVDSPLRMQKNDLVLVLEQDRTLSRVYLPYGDIPGLYGLLPTKVLNFQEEAVRKSNQVWAQDAPAYDQREGREVGTLLGVVEILGRNGNWCQVRPLSGGDDGIYWARAENLTVQFPSKVLDQDSP